MTSFQPWPPPIPTPGLPPGPPPLGPPPTPPPRRRERWWSAPVAGLGGGMVGGVVAALVLLVAAGDSDRGSPAALDVHALVESAGPSVVTITVDQRTLRGVFGGSGSGVVISEDGLILTNSHVISGADSISVTLFDGSTHEAVLEGSNPDDDIALIRISGAGELVPARLGSSGALEVGDEVVAIGNALDLGGSPSVTRGIVSATERTIEAQGITLEHLIQTDAAINPGNSGGPLLDERGEVVGLNTAIVEEAQNIGFAIAIDSIKPLISQITAGQAEITPDSVFLGVLTDAVGNLTPAELDEHGIEVSEGAVVLSVVEGSAAEEAGLEPGDVIVEMDGREVTSHDDVGEIITSHEPGDVIEIVYEREGERRSEEARLTTRAEAES